MKYCPKCGAQVSDSIKFCPKCGHQLPNQEQPANQTPNYQPGTNQPLNQQPLNNQPVNQQPVNSTNIQNTPVSDQMGTNGMAVRPNNNNVIMWIVIGVIAVIAVLSISFGAYTKTSSYRDFSTGDDDKVSKVVDWSNADDDFVMDADISLDDNIFELDPRTDGNFDSYYQDLEYLENDDDDETVESEIKNISEKVADEWGDDYSVRLLNPDDSSRYLIEAKDGDITYSIFD